MGASASKKTYDINPESSSPFQPHSENEAPEGQKSESQKSEGATVEQVVCNEKDLKDGEMLEVDVQGAKVLVARDNNEIFAIGGKCTHFGASLAKGAMCNGHVRCPFHGACFNLRTGDIEDYPGLDSVPKFDIEVSGGKVKVRATKKALAVSKRQKEMVSSDPEKEETFLIVGGGGASIACMETLRQEGFKGKVIVATAEKYLPYDRTKLSKSLASKGEDMALRNADFYSVYDIDIQREKMAESLDTDLKSVKFTDGSNISYDKLMIATGGSPRKLNHSGSDLQNISYLRTPEDANHIANTVQGKDVVIVGTSFIGMEVATFASGKAKSVTVIGRSEKPFQQSLGPAIGTMFQQLHEGKGTKFIGNNSTKEFVGDNGKLTEVVLEDGTKLKADLCIVGVGVVPATEWLKDSGLELTDRGFVVVDKYMKTNKENVFCAGDITQFPLFMADDQPANVQHWQMAHAQGRVAALNMLEQNVEIKSVPFFWTMQYGKSLRYSGYGHGYDDIILHGNVDDLKFVAFYTKDDRVVAIASMNHDPIVAQFAEMTLSGKTVTKSEISKNPQSWVSRVYP